MKEHTKRIGNKREEGRKTVMNMETKPYEPQMYLTEATIEADGSLRVEASPELPFKPGDRVSLTIFSLPKANEAQARDLRGTVLRYDHPFAAAATPEEWKAT